MRGWERWYETKLQTKFDELSRTTDDMKNLLNGTDIATIFLDGRLCINRYTEQARDVIRLICQLVLDGGEPRHTQLQVRPADATHDGVIYVEPVRDEGGRLIGLTCVSSAHGGVSVS